MTDSLRTNDRTRCPYCCALNDACTAVDPGTHPLEGAISLCAYCLRPAIFRADLTLREPTDAERPLVLAALNEAGLGASVLAALRRDRPQ